MKVGMHNLAAPVKALLDSLKSQITSVSQSVEGTQQSLTGLSQEISDTQQDVVDLSETVNGVQQSVSTVSGEVSTLRQNLTSLSESAESTQQDVNDVSQRATNLQQQLISLSESLGGATADVSGLYREVAYLKLKEEATDRIEGGTAFADDMNGTRFGITFNAAQSQNVVTREGKMNLLRGETTRYAATAGTRITPEIASTSGVGGRKLVRLSNGWLVAAAGGLENANVYLSQNGGTTWMLAVTIRGLHSDIALASVGTQVIVLSMVGASARISTFDPTVAGSFKEKVLASNFTNMGGVSLAIDPENNNVHAVWSCTPQNDYGGYDLFYTVSTDKGVTWAAIEPLTDEGREGMGYYEPSMTIRNGVALIATRFRDAISKHYIYLISYDRGSIMARIIYNDAIACYMPCLVTGPTGKLHVTWHGTANGGGFDGIQSVYYRDSLDGGNTWRTVYRMSEVADFNYTRASLTIDKDNKLCIIYQGDGADTAGTDSAIRMRQSSNGGTSWGSNTVLVNGFNATYPSALYDPTFAISFTTPPIVYMNASTLVEYRGDFSAYTETPVTSGSAVYDIPATTYVGVFVKKTGGLTVQAYLNDELMTSEYENNEYQFTKALAAEAPAKLRLELSRTSTTGGTSDAVTRLLGGRS